MMLLTAVFTSTYVSALNLKEVQCNNDGSMEFTVIGTDPDESYTKDMIVRIEDLIVNGTWTGKSVKDSYSEKQRYATFSMPENALPEKKAYKINLYYLEDDQSKTKEFEADCPGLVFSCSLLYIDVDRCYTDKGHFTAEITAKGLRQSNLVNGFNVDPGKALDFMISTKNPYKAKTNIIDKRGPLPSEFHISESGPDKYLLTFDLDQNNYVKDIALGLSEDRSFPLYLADKCRTSKYSHIKLSDYETCSLHESEEPVIVTPEGYDVRNNINQDNNQDADRNINENNTDNAITGQVIKNSYNAGNTLIFAAIIIVVLLVIILVMYSRIKKNRKPF